MYCYPVFYSVAQSIKYNYNELNNIFFYLYLQYLLVFLDYFSYFTNILRV